jgi:hypothetical protein
MIMDAGIWDTIRTTLVLLAACWGVLSAAGIAVLAIGIRRSSRDHFRGHRWLPAIDRIRAIRCDVLGCPGHASHDRAEFHRLSREMLAARNAGDRE